MKKKLNKKKKPIQTYFHFSVMKSFGDPDDPDIEVFWFHRNRIVLTLKKK